MQFKKFQDQDDSVGGNANFIKLSDGQSVVGVFRGEPYDFKQHYDKGDAHSTDCAGSACPKCAAGSKAKFRFRINFITKDAVGSYVAMIWEGSKKFYKTLESLQSTGYALEQTIVKVTRTGKDLQTAYTVLPVPNATITPVLEKTLNSISLHDLTLKKADVAEEGNFETMDDIPF